MDTATRDKWIVGGVVVGLAYWLFHRGPYDTFSPGAFFQPRAVQRIAAQLPSDEDAFILASWQWVADNIAYEPVYSDLTFPGGKIRCLRCFLPRETLARGEGNCVGQSATLASLLLNRLSPDRVSMVIGTLSTDGIGGHAWVTVKRGGKWYLLETTRPPGDSPWQTVTGLAALYVPSVLISPQQMVCYEPEVCLHTAKCDCGKVIEDLGHG